MGDHRQEGLERGRAGIDKAQAEKIEMDRSGDMALGELFRRPGVNKNKARSSQFRLEIGRGCEKFWSGVFFVCHKRLYSTTSLPSQTMLRLSMSHHWRAAFGLIAVFLFATSFTYQIALPGRNLSFSPGNIFFSLFFFVHLELY